MKVALKYVFTLVLGVLIGMYISRPHTVRAAQGENERVYVDQLTNEITNRYPSTIIPRGSQIVGFSCIPSGSGLARCFTASQ